MQKIKKLRFEEVKRDEEYDYIIMTNRVVWDTKSIDNPKKAMTCYEKFRGEDVITVKRRGLILSTVRSLK